MSKNLSLFGTPIIKGKDKNSLPPTPQNEEQSHQKQTNITNCFQGYPKYSLDYINSIFFKNGRIYNLLERTTQKRVIKCGCVKSFCEAKYCQCYRNGVACNDECGCKQCRNKKARKVSQPLQNGCKCRKSGCLKKYCECFQNARKCGPHCQCMNCSNGA